MTPNTRAEVLGVGSDLDHGIRAYPHQQIVNLPLVGACDVGDLFGQSKDQMEVAHRQQLSFPRSPPFLCSPRLAFWTMAVPA